MVQQMQAMMQQNQQLQAMLQNRRPDGMDTRPPPRASKSKSKKGGYSQRFSTEETDLLLNLIEEQMPMGQECWLKVLDKFNHEVPMERWRDKEGIQRRFNTLWRKRKPTGDPDCPPEVRRAKRLNYKIQEKSGMAVYGTQKENEFEEESSEIPNGEDAEEAEVNEEAETAVQVATAAPSPAPSPSPMSESGTSTSMSTSTKRKARNPKTGRKLGTAVGNNDENNLLKTFIESEKLNAAAREKRERRRDKQNRKQMEMFLRAMTEAATSVAVAIAGGKQKPEKKKAAEDSSISFSSDTLSDICSSDDSSPTIKAKMDQQFKRKIARKKKKEEKKNQRNMNESDDSN